MLACTAMTWLKRILIILGILLLGPLAIAAGKESTITADWRTASRQSSGLAPTPGTTHQAVVQVYAARAFSWRGLFAIHSWISVKPEGARQYTTYEVMGWRAFHGGDALNIHNDIPDRYWYGAKPELLTDIRGDTAAQAIENIQSIVATYPWRSSYRTYPGPNSNTFVAFISRNVPALELDLPPTAIGKDYLGNVKFIGKPPSGRGIQLSLWGLAGILISPVEGFELNILGLSLGVNPANLALRLPGVGMVKP